MVAYILEVGELSIPAEQECVPGIVESAIAVVMPQNNNVGVGSLTVAVTKGERC
jgi:hypothetical protein